MDKNALKKYAVWARQELISRVSQRALIYGISAGEMQENADSINGKLLTRREKSQRAALISRVKQIGYEQVIEEVAYTWFNRFCALRFMEVNGYLPSHVRVFTDENNAFNPQILTETLHIELEGLNKEIVFNLKEKNQTEELYKYLLIVQCNALNSVLPVMFQKIEDYTELLFPDNILREGSVVEQLVSQIPEEDWKDAVQIIGWLYQFYISVKKDEVYASKETITKDTLPAVTQLFTPDWIVRYMAENSIGRIWIESYPQSPIKEEMRYYIDDPEQPEEVQRKINLIKYKDVNPIDIKIIEPCCGSGHILVYAFDLLFKMYEEKGYQAREIPTLILKNNLFGLEIDRRAAQLAYFSLIMKARSANPRFFSERYYTAPKIRELIPSDTLIQNNFIAHLRELNILSMQAMEDFEYLVDVFEYAKTIGSLLKIKPLNYESIDNAVAELKNAMYSHLEYTNILQISLPVLEQLVEQAKVLSRKYDVMITNPPYIGISTMEAAVKDYAVKNYPDSKSDMFAMFMQTDFVKPNGFLAMINMHSWMFLSSYEKLRKTIITTKEIITMAHLGAHAFETIGGEVVQTTTFVIRNCNYNGNGVYYRLTEPTFQEGKEELFLLGESIYLVCQFNFSKIPGSPIAYWVSLSLANAYLNGKPMTEFVNTFLGIITGDNDLFLRSWYEIDSTKANFHSNSMNITMESNKYWIPYNKGGMFRRWYGIQEDVINWKNGPDDKRRGKKNYSDYYLREYVAWSYTVSSSSKTIATRYYPNGFLWDVRGSGIFGKKEDLLYLAALISCKVGYSLLRIQTEALSCQVENISAMPVIMNDDLYSIVNEVVVENIKISRKDYESFETSWDFKKHPLI